MLIFDYQYNIKRILTIALALCFAAGTYSLATVEGDPPRVRIFGTAEIFEGRLYIQTGKVKNVA